jgi:antitoxin ParD1/3/4
MERVTIRLDSDVLSDVEELVERGEYPNRSEVIRDALRELDGVEDPRELQRVMADGSGVVFPDDHPLAGKEHVMDTHAGHVQAYGELLRDVDPEDINSLMLVVEGDEWSETLPTMDVDVEPHDAAFRMLAAHIAHTASSMEAPPELVARHALHVLHGSLTVDRR